MSDTTALPPLQGRVVLVTRPAHQSRRQATLIREAGGEPLLFPTLRIEALAGSTAASVALANLPECHYAIFISANAVEHGLASLASEWPPQVRVVAIGDGTAAALRAHGLVEVIVPSVATDSDGVLALPELDRLGGMRVLIFRGQGGRELLADTLRKRGAEVAYVECYRRVRPDQDPSALLQRWERGGIHAVTAMSGETLENLWTMIGARGQPLLLTTPLFVPHLAIAERAGRLGLTEVAVTAPGDEGIVRGLGAWFSLHVR